MKKRCVIILFVLIWTLIVTGGRLTYIALGNSRVSAGAGQSLYTLTVDTPRGTVFDRDGQPITNRNTYDKMTLTPTPQVISRVHEVFLGAQKKEALERLSDRKPFCLRTATPFQAPGALVFSCKDTAPFSQPALHLVGYLDQQGTTGLTGLQKTYNTLLGSVDPTTVTYTCDALGGALTGVDPQPYQDPAGQRVGVLTTLSLPLQTAVQAAFPSLTKGAVVVQKAKSGELLALASFPDFSPTDIEGAMGSPDLPLLNRFLTGYNVGSVFKLCVAAAALEQGISKDFSYTCTGQILCGVSFGCHKQEGHGPLTMDKALAQSCNTYFIHLANRVGGQAIYQMAVALGLGQQTPLFRDGVGEAGGLPDHSELLRSPAELANFAIGQGKLMATPLQIAAMTCAIASGGIYYPPYVVAGTVDKGGIATYQKATTGNRVFSRQTADILGEMMTLVMTEGTGTAGATGQVACAGKTATAQTGILDENQKPVTQAWFTGFFPARSPEYIVTILVEGGASGGGDAAPIFGKICQEVTTIDSRTD